MGLHAWLCDWGIHAWKFWAEVYTEGYERSCLVCGRVEYHSWSEGGWKEKAELSGFKGADAVSAVAAARKQGGVKR
jgi:hypothetical protein